MELRLSCLTTDETLKTKLTQKCNYSTSILIFTYLKQCTRWYRLPLMFHPLTSADILHRASIQRKLWVVSLLTATGNKEYKESGFYLIKCKCSERTPRLSTLSIIHIKRDWWRICQYSVDFSMLFVVNNVHTCVLFVNQQFTLLFWPKEIEWSNYFCAR